MRERPVLVVCLCAAWCSTCGEFRDIFERLARANAQARFVWLDIEDDSALIGDVEVECFPTLAVFRDGAPLFYGGTLPHEGVVARVLAALLNSDAHAVTVPEQIVELPRALRSRLDR